MVAGVARVLAVASLALPGCIVVLDGDPVTASGGERFSGVESIDLSVATGILRLYAQDVDEVQVAWFTESTESNPAVVEAGLTNGVLRVRDLCDPLSFARCEANITVLVPEDWTGSIVANTGNGDVEAEGLSGEIALATGRGQLHATELAGEVSLLVSDGQLRIRGVQGTLNAEVNSGWLDAQALRGDQLSLTVSGGELEAGVVGGLTADQPSRVEVVLRSSEGVVVLPGASWDVDDVTIEAQLTLDGVEDDPEAPALLWVEAIDSTLVVHSAAD